MAHVGGPNAEAPTAASDQKIGGGSGGLHLRCRTDFLEQLAKQRSLPRHLKSRQEYALRAEAGIHGDQPAETPHEQKRACDEHEGDRDLHHHQQALKSEPSTVHGEPAASGLDDRGGLATRAAQRWHQPQQNARDRSDGGGEGQHTPIRGEIEMQGTTASTEKTENLPAQGGSQAEAKRGAGSSQQEAFRQRLANEPTPSCA